ncbi:MAG TPA: hypothetical protein VLJ79_16860 [Candidatus Binatia bacterium]|nr:hypothetical protein [Candidatus Binatia bacterium]
MKSTLANLGRMTAAMLQASFAQILSVAPIQILFFYPSIAGSSPVKENCQLEKPHCYTIQNPLKFWCWMMALKAVPTLVCQQTPY